MAESPEHKFLSEETLRFFERSSQTRLFSLLESERKRFDFTCTLERDWTRPIVGQVLWRHVEGVDKDLRTLLADPEAEVCLYIAADTTKARTLWGQCVRDFFRLQPASSMSRLRTVWVPPDLDLDSEEDRGAIQRLLADSLAEDVLLNVVLGQLSADSISQFSASTGSIGMDLAVLHAIATAGFVNLQRLSDRVGRSPAALRERLTRLTGCGFLTMPSAKASFYFTSLRGRVFLELCWALGTGRSTHPELQRILRLLDLVLDDGTATDLGRALAERIDDGVDTYGVDLANRTYFRYWESEAWPPMARRPSGFSHT